MTQTAELDVEISWENLDALQEYLRWLRRLPDRRLRRHHRNTFYKGHRYHLHLPDWVPRHRMERRLYFYFASVHCHLPHPYRRVFQKGAHAILTEPFDTTQQEFEELLWADLRALRRWQEDRTTELDDKPVGRILTIVGYWIEGATPNTERQILTELAEQKDIAVAYARNMQKLVGHRLNKHSLQDLILENPEMGWQEFQERFGLEMPTVTANSFFFTRSHLRSQGHRVVSELLPPEID